MFRLPPLFARDPQQPHRAATPLELLFDLISVIAIAAITAGLHHGISEGHGLEVLPRFIFLFIAVWWAWMNFTWFASAFDNDGPIYRAAVMVIMAGELVFAGGAGQIMATLDFGWGILGWCIMRLGMAVLWYRAASSGTHRRAALRYMWGILLAQALWVLLYLTVAPGSTAFFGLGILVFLVEFSVPAFAELRNPTPFHRHHMIERYGLLTIISLGEIMLSISLGFGALYGEHADVATAVTALGALFIALGLFWVYFTDEDHMVSSDFAPAIVWGYGHVLIFGAIAAIGAAVAAEIDLASHHSHITASQLSWWLGVPMAVFYAALWLVRDRHYHLGRATWSLPVMAVLSILGAAMALPVVGFAVIAVIAQVWRAPFRAGVTQD